ncbi:MULTISPECIES: Tic20 family protein [Okeania]|uniref:Tic20 family protein n=1 Tax=Okeania hirsuta TaxID=1458930 RepID=A0A3N6Q3Q4_9CYAN|nr:MULTISPECIES: Tic20 family protein [Okeania]NES77890.1 hypothetical protein [Okeania sp. SIO1H4]NES89308.1 hypothetical protein [Okeania sp. SIO2B9]NET20106.1 hypothetical protein [Okeania sp. SIO1H5]NET76759.1 hypothetical protein [Okeania sp. SIO1F9]NET92115.1 hypothetical protein [Okeania sp. SIO1H2]
MNWRGSTTVQDRIFASLPYLLPLLDGLVYGRYLFQQFPPIQIIPVLLSPLLQIYRGIPFFGLIVFFALFLLVVRNENISHFIRFNTMQAILLDIILILCGLILQILGASLGGFILETLSNMIFIGILASFIYAVVQSVMGRYAEIPTISEAVYMQVR